MKFSIRKLRQNKGASLIIALVFMLFCIFVGGSILASAAANSARLKRTIASDQDYLHIRSAAVLLADELRSSKNGTQLSFNVTLPEVPVDASETVIEGEEPALDPVLECLLSNRRTLAREQFYYCAACQYYNLHQGESCVNYATKYPLTGIAGSPKTSWDTYNEQYKDKEGNIRNSIEIPLTVSFNSVTLNALMVCGGTNIHGNDNDYNIFIYFYVPKDNGEIDHYYDDMHIEMTVGRLYDEADIFFVTWGAPKIVKGGR